MVRYLTLKICFCLIFVLSRAVLSAQLDSLKGLSFSGYGEVYYSYDFSEPANRVKPGFIYNHKRHNEVEINLFLLRAKYEVERWRAHLSLMTGNYCRYNLSAEPDWAQAIFEANVGVKLSKKRNIWMDAGIMPSHIGFESAISADCWTLTRSILAENSPYYETGVKFGYTSSSEKLNVAVLVLNGWQKIKTPEYIRVPCYGIQVTYKPKEKLVLNYSYFIGTDKPDSASALRTYHNLYVQYESAHKWGITAGFDLGTDMYDTSQYGAWFSPVLIMKYQIWKKTSVAVRGEYYFDKNQILIYTGTPKGFQVIGVSANVDYAFSERVVMRLEGKMYNSADPIFRGNENNNYSLTTNITLRI